MQLKGFGGTHGKLGRRDRHGGGGGHGARLHETCIQGCMRHVCGIEVRGFGDRRVSLDGGGGGGGAVVEECLTSHRQSIDIDIRSIFEAC